MSQELRLFLKNSNLSIENDDAVRAHVKSNFAYIIVVSSYHDIMLSASVTPLEAQNVINT